MVTEVVDADLQLVKRLAQLERELAKRAPAVAERRRALLEQQLAETVERLAAAEAERDALAASLDQLRGRHEALAAERAAHLGERDREQAAAVEPRVTVRWTRSSPAEGCHVGDKVYAGHGPAYRQVHGPGGRPVEQLARPGDELELPVGHAQVLVDAGFVEPATDRDDQFISYDRLLHGALVLPGERVDPASRWAVDDGLRRTPVPDGWPEELTYVALHPDPPEPVYGVPRPPAGAG